jgi:hypothetical protein
MARKFLARLRAILSSHRRPMPGLHELLERAGVPRSASPELLQVAQLADLRLDGEGEGEGEGDKGGEGEGDKEEEPEEEPKKEEDKTDWKAESRKHEKRAKSERSKSEKLEKELQAEREKNQTDQEKELEKARKEGKAEAESKVQEERRNDRLEVAVAKRAKDVADVDDVLLNIQRAIDAGEIDEDEIFDDKGKVQTKALNTEIDDLLDRKPHLKAGGSRRPSGRANGGEGSGGDDDGDMNDLIRRKAGRS